MWSAIALIVSLLAFALVVSRILRGTPFEGRPFG